MLEEVFGGADCFGEDAPEESRWRVILESGCQEGEELRALWASLQQEEQQAAGWLRREGQETLSQELESVGGSSTDGST